MGFDKKVAIIIPFYKDSLNFYESIAVQQCFKVLGHHPIIAIKPKHLTLPTFPEKNNLFKIIDFENHYFESLAGYNKLMMNSQFYKQFLEYDYILIHQLDSFVFKDDLLFWCDQNYDYVGAPWIKKTYHKPNLLLKIDSFLSLFKNKNNPLLNKVGNGGFSLRKVNVFYKVCENMQEIINLYNSNSEDRYNEDVFWSIEVNRENRKFNIPSAEVALKFAFEVPAYKSKDLNKNNTPFGCHDWDKYNNYWRPIFQQLGYNI